MIKKYNAIPNGIKASLWFLVCSVLQKGISIFTTPIFTRLMSTEEYGRYSVFMSWLTLLTVIVTLSLSSETYMRGIVKFEADKEKYTSSLQGLLSSMVLLAAGVYMLFRSFWNSIFRLPTQLMIAIFISMWMSTVFGFWAIRQRIEYRYHALVILTVISSFLKPICGILSIVFLNTDKVDARVFSIVGVEAVCFGGIAILQWRRSHAFYNKSYWHYALALNIPLLPHYLAQNVLAQSDRVMIERLIGLDKAGIYSVACSIAMIMSIISASIQSTLNPFIFKRIARKEYKNIGKICNISLILISAVNLLLIAAAPEIVRIFAPIEYMEAIWVIPPIAASSCFRFLYMMFSNIEFHFEKTKYMMLASGVTAVLNIVLNALFMPHFGYLAAGYTTLFCYFFFAYLHYTFAKKIFEANGEKFSEIYNVKTLAIICTIFLFLVAVFMSIYPYIIVRIGMVAIIGCAACIIAIKYRSKIKSFIIGIISK